jgi:predicted NACHT family NTPase
MRSARFSDVGGQRLSLSGLPDYYLGLGDGGRLVILGKPGSGKTVATIHLVLRLLAQRQSGAPVPVRFALADWDPAMDAEEFLVEHLVRDYAVSVRRAHQLVENKRILPVLDGLDEMDLSTPSGQRTGRRP